MRAPEPITKDWLEVDGKELIVLMQETHNVGEKVFWLAFVSSESHETTCLQS